MQDKVIDFSFKKGIWTNVEDSLDACDSMSTEIDDLVDNLRDIRSKVDGHPNKDMLMAIINRTSFSLTEALSLKIRLFDDFYLMKKLFYGEF